VGQRVTLRAPQPRDLERRQRHGFHAEIERSYGHSTPTRPCTRDEAEDWFARIAQPRDGEVFWVLDVDGELAGFAGLQRIESEHRRATYVIGMLAPEYLGWGLGREAAGLVLDHAFGSLGLHRIDLRVLAFNERAIRSYRATGFVEEGRERDSCWMDGQWHDDVMMSILEDEHAHRRPR
jgi:RimJ/RimL family protein N-acetyltransferase